MFALVLIAASCSVGQWDYWQHTTPLQGSSRRAILADAYGFGVDSLQASKIYHDSRRQFFEMRPLVLANNASNDYDAWRHESLWRNRCWDLLDDALNVHLTPAKRLAALEELLETLGEEDYYARRMPTPTPAYRTPTR